MDKTVNILQEMPNPEATVSVSCSRRAKVFLDDVALNARALK